MSQIVSLALFRASALSSYTLNTDAQALLPALECLSLEDAERCYNFLDHQRTQALAHKDRDKVYLLGKFQGLLWSRLRANGVRNFL
jgi:hypothetical protein